LTSIKSLTRVSLIYCTEPTTKKWEKAVENRKKLKSKKTSKELEQHNFRCCAKESGYMSRDLSLHSDTRHDYQRQPQTITAPGYAENLRRESCWSKTWKRGKRLRWLQRRTNYRAFSPSHTDRQTGRGSQRERERDAQTCMELLQKNSDHTRRAVNDHPSRTLANQPAACLTNSVISVLAIAVCSVL